MVLPPNNPPESLPSTSGSSSVMQDYVQTSRSAQAPGNEPLHTEVMSGPSSPSSQSSWSTYEKFYQHPHQGEYTTEPQQDDLQTGYPWHLSENRKFSATSTNTYYNSNQDDHEYQQYDDEDEFEQAKHYQQQQSQLSHQHQQRHATHPSSKSRSGSSRSKHMNAHTTCGRHSDQWLFQGWRVPSILKGKRRRNKDGIEEEDEEEEERQPRR